MNKHFMLATFLSIAGGIALVATGCSNNKYKSMTEVSEAQEKDSTEAVLPLDTHVNSAVDSALMAKYNAAFFENTSNKGTAPTADKWVETASGLRYVIVKEGSGKNPGPTSEVTVHYTGMLTDGQIFDSSVSRGEPTSFPLNRVIPGWTEGLQLMKPGGVAVFYIPGKLAYGEQGQPAAGIGPDATLIFGVELLSVN